MKENHNLMNENWQAINNELSLDAKNELAKFIWNQLSEKLQLVLKECNSDDNNIGDAIYQATLVFTIEVLGKMALAANGSIEAFCGRFIEDISDAFELNYQYQPRTEEDEYYIKKYKLDKKSKS